MKKVALILHGWPDYNVKFHFLTEDLEKNRYEVITPNLFNFEDDFKLEESVKRIKEKLDGRIPNLNIGISFEGFVLPAVAKKYPNSKLIFIAAGPFFKPDSGIFGFFLKISKYKISVLLCEGLLKLPNTLIKFVYLSTYLFRGDSSALEIYKKDMDRNLGYIKKIPVKKDIEVLKFVNSIDNSKLLKNLKNQSLIFSSKNDHYIPLYLGKALHKLLKNSELIIKDGEHFNVFEESDLKTVDEFLKK